MESPGAVTTMVVDDGGGRGDREKLIKTELVAARVVMTGCM